MLFLVVILSEEGLLFNGKNSYEVTEKIDSQFATVQNYVQNCLDSTSREALEKLGSQGGYIDPLNSGLSVNYPSSKQGASAFKFTEGSNLVVPYWYYLSSQMDCSGNCYFDSKAPELEGPGPLTIQSQLKNYVQNNVNECLNDFQGVKDLGYDVEVLDNNNVDVLIRENDVRFFLKYPIEVTKGSSSQKITQFAINQAVPLKPLYNYAALLTAAQAQYTYLERHTISVISFNSGPSSKLLPPTSATTYDYVSTVFWLKSRVKQQLQELLMTYIPGLQVANSRNFEQKVYAPDSVSKYGQAAIQRVYDNMILPLNSTRSGDSLNINKRFDVSFEYLDWPIYFDVNSEGEIIKPHSLAVSDFLFGMQQYDTYYDITYPVRVVLYDPSALKESGYTFAFGLQGNIRGSAPLDENYTLLNGGGNNAGTFVCNPDQYNSGESSITVTDDKTGQPIGDVALTFACGGETCSVGTTNGDGKWSGKLPICGGATLTFAKDSSYAQRSVQLSTNLDEVADVTDVTLEPFRVLNATVEKKLISKSQNGEWEFVNSAVPLASSEFAIVSYKQVDEKAGTDPVQGAFIYYGGVGPTEETNVKLVPGIYEVSIQSIMDEPLIVPKQERSKRVLFKKIKFTIPEIKMDQFPSGSLTLNDTHGYWYVSANDLDSGVSAVKFLAISPNIPGIPQAKRVVEDLQILNEVDSYMSENYNALLPTFEYNYDFVAPDGDSLPIVTLQPLFFGSIEPGNDAQFSVSVVGSGQISSVEIISPIKEPTQKFVGSLITVPMPEGAYGPTVITMVFTFADGTRVTKSTTVNVKGASELSDISVRFADLQPAQLYQFSNSTINSAQLSVIASFADGSNKDFTDSILGTQYETSNESVVDLGENGRLLFYNAGDAVITVTVDDKSVEIPITITE